MEIRNVEDCFNFRLLRKISPDKEKSERSIKIAKDRLERADKSLKMRLFDFAILDAYMAMFHSARAILYRDGIQEKSHYSIFVYLKEKYSKRIPVTIINTLNIHRIERHESMYGLEFNPSEGDALTSVEDARLFVSEMTKELKKPAKTI
ncbi:HEPN domain-containing protein [Candidatus Woesearchaeota archaeon]|nr:HEPN domain-containing protein [Candidatus Woesearchaeota archaeon]